MLQLAMISFRVWLVIATACPFLAGCGGADVAGVYELDRAAFREAELAAMPPGAKKEQAQLSFVDNLVSTLDGRIELKDDGTASMKIKVPMFGIDEPRTGSWKLEGSKLTFLTKNEDGKEAAQVVEYARDHIVVAFAEADPRRRLVFRRK